jgi:hypothetical protein
MRRLLLAAVTAMPLLFAVAPETGARGAETGTLALHAELRWQGGDSACPPATPSTIDCHPHPGGPALVPGLGRVRQEYLYPVVVVPPAAECRARDGLNLADYSARLIVERKGEITLSVKGIDDCLLGPPSDTIVNNTQSFTVTGGSGVYAGASGGGTVEHVAGRNAAGHAVGSDLWEGTLVVSGLAFDLAAPTIRGAAAKIVRAARGARTARVTFAVSADDDVDGRLPALCKPGPGTRFKLGTTRVTCSAADTSGNAATAAFAVTVKARR